MSDDGGELILSARGVGRTFRGLQALADYALDLRQGEILGVIGPNGAGKTTLCNVVTGFLPPTAGMITFQGRDVTGLAADRIAKLGIARTFQNIRLFTRMTVPDNVKAAQQLHGRVGLVETLLSAPSFLRKERALEARARQHLDAVGLGEVHDAYATSRPYGFQRNLEIARALATEPAVLLLLDEPATGMNAQETAELTACIRESHDRSRLTVIVVEHDMSLIMRHCERIQVLNCGRVIAQGSPAAIRANPAVIEAYLGADEEGVEESRSRGVERSRRRGVLRSEHAFARLRGARAQASGHPSTPRLLDSPAARVLTLEGIRVYPGMIQAVQGISFEVQDRDLVAPAGSSGAGKTTPPRTMSRR